MSSAEHQPDSGWRFVSNHTQVLLCLANEPDVRLRDVAANVGITERAAQRIVADLVQEGFVTRQRVGRRNRYLVNRDHAMRHPAQAGIPVGALLDLLQVPVAQ
jgi:DNA-binding MarR family transcriptional regulator